MDYLRTIVSGHKKRFIQDGFNLDLTYITDRIVAMAFPAEGFESLYRNPINKVVGFLEAKHQDNYLVVNLSNRTYDFQKFSGKVISCEWDNHHAPPLYLLFELCRKMHEFLLQNPKNVIVVHCLAGKGRTGTLICCYLLFSGEKQETEEVLEFYEKARFNTAGLGVNQPCQIRYISYFQQLLNGKPGIHPTQLYLESIVFDEIPSFNREKGCKVFAKIYQNKQLVRQTQIVRFAPGEKSPSYQIKLQQPPLLLSGDIMIEFFNSGSMKTSKMMRVSFNTMFGPGIKYGKADLDPYKVNSDARFPQNFKLYAALTEHCDCRVNSSEYCMACAVFLKDQLDQFRIIQDSIEYIRTFQ